MSRNKLILWVALVLLIILVLAFAFQVRRLQKQLRSSVRIIPAESKSREDVAQNELYRDAARSSRPEVLVKFRSGVSENTIEQITARFNDQLQDEIEAVPGLTTIDDPDDAEAVAIAARYQALPEVEYAEPNYEISLDQASSDERLVNDPRLADEWWLANIRAAQAWATTKGSSAIVIAILDSGVEYTHPDLVNNIWQRPANITPYQDRDLGTIDDVHGYNAVSNDGAPLDDNGHGTSCAGIIGAECGNNRGICGVNWTTQIMPLKFMNAGGFGTVADALEAVNYAIDRKRAGVNLRIINASWGLAQPSRALEDVIRKAYEAGILFVAAAGSISANNDTTPHYPASYNTGNIISVAAVDQSEALAPFSNYGAKSVNIAAPGTDILTTALGNEYERRSGTSLAAPVVTGVAALALSARPEMSVDQLRRLLLESVDKRPGLRGKVSTAGRINAARAMARK
ncbi:MAG TPA: S8 family peptidase [Pyrinomonadaceae bacterium]|nr:S8 family peptidase [Pyrinomonadaceae bacterium]